MDSYRRNGYKMLYLPKHHRASTDGCVYEHIVVAEQKLGRSLKPEEVVHHEDEVRDNNDPNNLYVFRSNRDHIIYHGSKLKEQLEDGVWIGLNRMEVCSLKGCNKTYVYDPDQKFCSQECVKLHRRVVERPSKDELEVLIGLHSFVAIGKMYSVSDNAVRKWCKSYGLPHLRKNIK